MKEADVGTKRVLKRFNPGELLFGKFKIDRFLGYGGSAVVYKCHAMHVRHPFVAVKLFPADIVNDAEASIRLSREMRTAFLVDDPNVTRYIDLARNDSYIGLVIEFVEGKPLEDLLSSLREHGLGRTLSIASQIALGLKGIHDAGIVHRDIKPGNVLVSTDWVAKITDFGLAVNVSELVARSGAVTAPTTRKDPVVTVGEFKTTSSASLVGTPSYVSPEYVLDGTLDIRSDLYSFGVLFFEMVTGQLPHESDSLLGLFEQKVLEPAPRADSINEECPPALADMIDKLLNRDPEQRYQTAYELVNELNSFSIQWHAEGSRLSKQRENQLPPPTLFERLFCKPIEAPVETAAPKEIDPEPIIDSVVIQQGSSSGQKIGRALIAIGVVALLLCVACLTFLTRG